MNRNHITTDYCSTCHTYDQEHAPTCPRTKDPLAVPLCHMNGTGRADLREQSGDALEAVNKAIRALVDISPNGRDFYPLGDDATATAIRQHRERLERLESVRAELEDIHTGIAEQCEEYEARKAQSRA